MFISIGIFLSSAHLICRSTDISKHFRESLRLQDNESRLYSYNMNKNPALLYMNTRTMFWHVIIAEYPFHLLKDKYSRTSMARTRWGHETMKISSSQR